MNPLIIPSPYIARSLAVSLAQHNVNAAENNHNVGNLRAFAQFTQHRQIDERWSANVIAIRIRLAGRDDVEAQLAFRPFHTPVRFTRRGADVVLRLAGHDLATGWHIAQHLLANLYALAHLVHADEVAVVDVAVRARANLEVEPIVDAVRLGAADVIGHTRGAQQRAAGAVGNGLISRQHTHAEAARADDFVLSQIGVEIVDGLRQAVEHHVVNEVHRVLVAHLLGDVARYAAKTHIVA